MTILLIVILLGIIQGFTEFLPISSTGHLIIVEHLLGVSQKTFGLSLDIALHIGTAFALIVLFWKDLKQIMFESVKKRFPSPLLVALVTGTIPAGIAGLLLEDFIEANFRSPKFVAISLFVFSGLLLLGDYRSQRKKIAYKQISLPSAFLIGIFQAIAIIPGVSRSGSTITGGLIAGYSRPTSARFAFLLSIPIILLAGAKQTVDLSLSKSTLTPQQFLFFTIGSLTAAITAFIVAKWFLSFFEKHGFLPFIIYRLSLALAIIIAIGLELW